MDLYYVGLLFISFISSYILTSSIMKKMINVKYGIDLHKKEKTKVAELGGIAPVSVNIGVLSILNPAVSIVMALSGIVGIVDDIAKLSPWQKLILLGLIGIPAGLLLDFNLIKIISLILGISIVSNLTNMLAGFNGLEIGLGIISSFFIGLVLLLKGDFSGFQIVMVFTASYLGFFMLNKYPAKVFPGDVGTLPIGAFLATIAVWKDIIPQLVIVLTPYLLDAFLKYYTAGVTKREDHKPTTLKNGKLYVEGGYLSLPRLILKKKPMKEYEIVWVLWSISAFFGILSLIYTTTQLRCI